jgi:hypothetical protein
MSLRHVHYGQSAGNVTFPKQPDRIPAGNAYSAYVEWSEGCVCSSDGRSWRRAFASNGTVFGDRTPGDEVAYPDDDIKAVLTEAGWKFVHKDGTPYE